MSEPLTFVLPLPPNMGNYRGHWRGKETKRTAYIRECDMRATALGYVTYPAPTAPVRLTSTLYMGAHMDDDNALARLKWPVDWLKTRGYLVDDRRTHCRMTIPEQVVKRNQEYRVEITLSPLGE